MLEFSLLLESMDEIEHAAGGRKAFAQKMQVVRHEAIGVNREAELIGYLREYRYEASHHFRITQERLATLTTDCEEVGSLTDIVVGRKADIFARDWHLCRPKMPP